MASDPLSPAEQAAESARGSFSTGSNCAESVFDAVGASLGLGGSAIPSTAGFAWTGGIDESGCLCGALAAAVSLAGQVAAIEGGTETQQRLRARGLADEIRREFVDEWKGTCCRIVRDGREFGTPECRDSCADVTAFATRLAIDVLGRERDVRDTGTAFGRRVGLAAGTGVLLGLEAAWALALGPGAAVAGAAAIALATGAGLAWGVAAATSVPARRTLARTGRALAAAGIALAAVFALGIALAPAASALAADRVASALGAPALAGPLAALWVAVTAVWAAPAVFDLARRRGAR